MAFISTPDDSLCRTTCLSSVVISPKPYSRQDFRIERRAQDRADRRQLGAVANQYQLAVGPGINILEEIVEQLPAAEKRGL